MEIKNLYDIINRTSLKNIRDYHQGKFGGMVIKLMDYNCIPEIQKPVYEFFGKITTALEDLDPTYRKFSLSLTGVELVKAVDYAINNGENLPLPEHNLIGELEAAWTSATDEEQEEFAAILQAFQALDVLIQGTAPELEENRAKNIRYALSESLPSKQEEIFNGTIAESNSSNSAELLLLELAEKFNTVKQAYNALIRSKNQKCERYCHDFNLFDAYVDFSFSLQSCEREIADASVLNGNLFEIYKNIVLDDKGEVANFKKTFEEISSTSKAISKRMDYQIKLVPYEIDETNSIEVEANRLYNIKISKSAERNEERVEKLKKLGKKFPRAYLYAAIYYIAELHALDSMKAESNVSDVNGLSVETCLEQASYFFLKYFYGTYKLNNSESLNRCLFEIFILNADFSLKTNSTHIIQEMIKNLNLMIEDESDVEAAKFFVEEAQNFYVGKRGKNYNSNYNKLKLLSLDGKFKPVVRTIIFVVQAILTVGLMFIVGMNLPFARSAEIVDVSKLAILSAGITVSVVLGYLFGGKISIWNRLVIPIGAVGVFALCYASHLNTIAVESVVKNLGYPYLVTISPAIALCFTKPYKFRALLFNFNFKNFSPLIMAIIWGVGILFLFEANSKDKWFLELLIYLGLGFFSVIDTMSSEFISHIGEKLCARALVLWISAVVYVFAYGSYKTIADVFIVMAAITILMYPAYRLCATIHDKSSKF